MAASSAPTSVSSKPPAARKAGGFDETLFGAEEAAMSRALRRQGRFVILRESVTTSGRKLRAHSGREVLGVLLRLALAGPKAVRRRDSLDIWYGERRADPDGDGLASNGFDRGR